MSETLQSLLKSDHQKVLDELYKYGVIGISTDELYTTIHFKNGKTWKKTSQEVARFNSMTLDKAMTLIAEAVGQDRDVDVWCWSSDGEQYFGDEFTREAAMHAALDDAGAHIGGGSYVCWTGKQKKVDLRQYIRSDYIAEMIGDNAYEYGPEFSSSEWPALTKEQSKNFADHIAKWFEKNRPPDFFTVEDIKEHTAVVVGDPDDDNWEFVED